MRLTMKLITRLFYIAWGTLLVLGICGVLITTAADIEEAVMLGIAYLLSLTSSRLCFRKKPKTALGNLIAMVLYNALLVYNFEFNSQYGAGLLWWFYILILNTLHSLFLLLYILAVRYMAKYYRE